MYFYEPLYRSPSEVIVDYCVPMKTDITEMCGMDWIPMTVWNESCTVWLNGQFVSVPPLPSPKPGVAPKKPTDLISTVDLIRLVAKGRARLVNFPQPAQPITQPIVQPTQQRRGPCEMETCDGRCGMPLHTRSNVTLAKAVRTGHILWGDLD
jgi:hypothetical protein